MQSYTVLGEMAEVDQAERAHREIVRLAEQLGVQVVAIATDLYGVDVNHDLPEFVRSALATGNTAVLVKGSRVVGLERLIDDLISS